MKSGSLVTLKRALSVNDLWWLRLRKINKYPQLGEVYEVDFIRPSRHIKPEVPCIVLKEFPDIESADLDMAAETFVEILPPLEDIMGVEEESTKQKQIREPVQFSLSSSLLLEVSP